MHMVIAKGRSLFDQFQWHGSEYRIRIGHHVRQEGGLWGLDKMTRIFPDVLLFQESGMNQTLFSSCEIYPGDAHTVKIHVQNNSAIFRTLLLRHPLQKASHKPGDGSMSVTRSMRPAMP